MTLFFNHMLGCLLIAAGIGGVVGWLLRHVSADKSAQQLADVTAMMHLKEQMLEKARHHLREATSRLQAIENPEATLQEVDPQSAEQDPRLDDLKQFHQQLREQREENEILPTEKAA
jgi:vacuolar-type H+-ATPase subunit I/STV1